MTIFLYYNDIELKKRGLIQLRENKKGEEMEREKFKKLKKFICEDYITVKKNLYTKVCNKLESFHNKKENMKLRGFNDFNFMNLLVGFENENSHSKIIAEFFNPYGSHYQGELFLEKFFEILNYKSKNLKEWKFFTEFFVENVTGKGQGRIDILLRNPKENKFIIIENKIYAGDQDYQVYKYVEDLYSKFKIKSSDDILVLYLTPFERKISKESLGNYKVENGYLIDTFNNQSNKKALFKNITYDKEILEWIEKSLKEIENICSLKESLKQYQQAVIHITNKKGDIMNLEEYLKKLLEGDEEEREIIKTLIVDFEDFKKYADEKCLKVMEEENITNVIDTIKKHIRKTVIEKIKENVKKINNYNVETLDFGNKWVPLIIFKNSWKKCEKYNTPLLYYALELDKWEYKGLYYGIKKCDKDTPYKDNDILDKLKKINERTGFKSSPWWLSWKWFEYPYNMIKGDEKEFYIETINEFHKLDKFVEKHYIKPLLDYINKTESILEGFYKMT